MRRFLVLLILIVLYAVPICAMEIAPPEVPEEGELYMPEETESFAEGLWYIVSNALQDAIPQLGNTVSVCIRLTFVVILGVILTSFTGTVNHVIRIGCGVLVGTTLLSPVNDLMNIGIQAICVITEYGKLLIPVLTATLAAQGGVTSSAALAALITFFSTVLATVITKLCIPMLYIYFCLSICNHIVGNELLKNIHKFLKWLIVWSMKIVLYVFTGIISITGVITGAADASSVKAVKLSLSGMIPVVGGIISEASETILVSAGLVKNAVSIYGLLAIAAVVVGPFLTIGVQYLLLKITGALCSAMAPEDSSKMILDFSGGVGMLLGMTGTISLLFFVGITCFMKGMT